MNFFSIRIRLPLFLCLSLLLFYAISTTSYLQRGLYLLVTAQNMVTSRVSPISAPTIVSNVGKEAAGSIRFAVIGDYGVVWSSVLGDLAEMIKSWEPDFVTTVGDNNYPYGAATTIDLNIGQFYQEFIYPYRGDFGPGAESNRFWPALGNHDWNAIGCSGSRCRGPYFDYFTLPNNERYYDFVQGAVHFFMLDSDRNEPDGITAGSKQAIWLQERLAASTAPWKLVYLHHPPYSSGRHGSHIYLQWPYHEWGADAVLAGHDHMYERISQDDIPYFVNGAGGAVLYQFQTPIAGSQVRYNDNHGAMLVEANRDMITFQFINRSGELIDSYTIEASHPPTSTVRAVGRLTWPAMADAYVQESTPTANYGDESVLQSSRDPHKITYLKFDLSDLADLEVVSAKLRMWVANDEQAGTRSHPEIRLVDENSWDEMSLTYNNRPALSTLIRDVYATQAGDRIEIDLTERVSNTVGRPLSLAINGTSSDDLHLHSRESIIESPVLIIDYNGNGPTPVVRDLFPRQGIANTHNEINIYGQHFQPESTISINAALSPQPFDPSAGSGHRKLSAPPLLPTVGKGELEGLTSTFISANHLRAVIPANHPSGIYNLQVTNPDGKQTTYTNAYTLLGSKDDDLTAFDYELLTDPHSLKIGQQSQIALIVHRQGGSETLSNVAVNFYEGSHLGPLIGSTTVPMLAPNSITSTPPITWTPSVIGQTTIYAVIDPTNQVPETIENNNKITRSVTLLPQSNDQTAPTIGELTIDGGLIDTFDRIIELGISEPAEQSWEVSPSSSLANLGRRGQRQQNEVKNLGEIRSLFVTEFEYHQGIGQWLPAQQSGWQPYTTSNPTFYWKIQPTEGIKYLQVWAVDEAHNISTPKGAWISYLPSSARLATDLSHFYAYTLSVTQTITATINPTSGDPDLYIWSANENLTWQSINATGESDQVAFTAPQDGTYIIQVYAYEAAEYNLDISINPTESNYSEHLSPSASLGQATSRLKSKPNGNKTPLEQPGLAPDGLPQSLTYALPATGTATAILRKIYLPLLLR